MKAQIEKFIREKKIQELKEYLQECNEKDISYVLEELESEHMLLVFRLLTKDRAAEVFSEMGHKVQETLIKALNDKELKDVLDELYTDDTVDMIGEMPANVVKRILQTIPKEEREIINQFLSYPKDCAGSIMTNEFIDLKENITVKQALEKIKQEGMNKETIYTCYVLDKTRKLIGLVSIRDLLLADEKVLIKDLMTKKIIKSHTLDDREVVARKLQKYNFLALPIVDSEEKLVGIVTFDDALEVLKEENTEDFSKMSAVTPSDNSYFKTSVLKHAKNRIVWLLFLMVSAMITGSVITSYEEAFAALPILVSFIPLIMGTGGNSGSQASTLIIRGLAVEEIKPRDILKAMFKELRIAILVGVCLATIMGTGIFLIYKDIKLSIVVAVSLIFTIILAKQLGCILPILAKKLKLDPAIMAAPLISTIVDTCSVFIYFTMATWLFNI